MKHSTYATLITGLLLAVAAVQGATVAYWDFEDGVDGQLFDADGGGDSGSYDTVGHVLMRGYDSQWGSSFSSDNLLCNGLCMRVADNQQDGYVVESILQSWAPTNWTVECTVRLDDLAGWNTLIGRDGSSFGEPESDFYLQNNGLDDSFRLNYKTASGQRVIIDASNVAVQPGQWYGLAVVSDGTNVSLYIDDRDGNGYELEGSTDLTSTNVAENALAGSAFTWTFGRGWYNGNFVDRINGAMDNIRFSDKALTTAELIPVPVDPFVITYSPTEALTETTQTIEATIIDEDSDFSSAVLLLDGTPVATNNTPSGATNAVSHAAEGLYAGTHSAEVVVAGINPSVTATQRWTFVVEEAPVEAMIDGATPGLWTMDLEAAKNVAAEKKLPILLDFSGSDWCGWCKLMEKNVFTMPEWKAYATNHLMMVLIDFPRDKSLVPEKYVERNRALSQQYKVQGYPTYVVLDDDGETELGRLRAGREKTPASFHSELQVLLGFRPAGIEAFTTTLSAEDKAAYLALLDELEATKESKEQAQTEMTDLQMKLMQLEQAEERLKDDIRFFHIAQRLDQAEREAFEALAYKLQEAKKSLAEWIASKPDQNEENMKLFQDMYKQIEELEGELSNYE